MPLLTGKGCKAKPHSIIAYITRSDKTGIVSSFYLDDNRNYAEQFKETADLFHKGKGFGERKYYHFIHSFNPDDNVSYADAHRMTEELIRRAFPENEVIIATHNDTDVVHCHVVLNAVSFVDGRKIHLNNQEYARLKDMSNEIALEHGYSTLDWRKPTDKRETTAEHNIIINGGTSWKEQLREVINEALKICCTMDEFEDFLKQFNVQLSRNTAKTISFLHPKKSKAIRGEKLGQIYTKGAILYAVTKNYSRTYSTGIITETTSGAVTGAVRNEEQPVRELTPQATTGRVHTSVSSTPTRDETDIRKSTETDTRLAEKANQRRKKHSRGR